MTYNVFSGTLNPTHSHASHALPVDYAFVKTCWCGPMPAFKPTRNSQWSSWNLRPMLSHVFRCLIFAVCLHVRLTIDESGLYDTVVLNFSRMPVVVATHWSLRIGLHDQSAALRIVHDENRVRHNWPQLKSTLECMVVCVTLSPSSVCQ